MDYAIPASKIATLSSGEFVGVVADNPKQKISLKMFHSEIQNDHQAIADEEAEYKPIPEINAVSYADILENYSSIKADIDQLVKEELKKIEAKNPKPQEDAKPEAQGDDPMEQQGIVM